MQAHPQLNAIQAKFLNIKVIDPPGPQPRSALVRRARARDLLPQGSLDYFHTHICAPNATNCFGPAGRRTRRGSGSSTAPGKLTVGVLLPEPGTWRLFLQTNLGGHNVTAPSRCTVAS